MNRSFIWAGPETSTIQWSMSQHVAGSLHISAGWGLPLLPMGFQHKHNEHRWILERRAFVGHLPSLFSLHR